MNTLSYTDNIDHTLWRGVTKAIAIHLIKISHLGNTHYISILPDDPFFFSFQLDLPPYPPGPFYIKYT